MARVRYDSDGCLPIIFGGLFLCVIFGGCAIFNVCSAYFEASAYNRVTGANVSTWDAIWLDLRVQESPK